MVALITGISARATRPFRNFGEQTSGSGDRDGESPQGLPLTMLSMTCIFLNYPLR